MDSLYEYSWPGNVRELENVVERLVVLNQTGLIEKADLPEQIQQESQVMIRPDPSRFNEQKIIPLKAVVAASERKRLSELSRKITTLVRPHRPSVSTFPPFCASVRNLELSELQRRLKCLK
ncbi:MAG TPA: hypothetical protein VFC84_14375 [Desulfosporosinus sp.]|nr:hypothetical protein [Desulfosporosinus sp.]